MGNRSDVQCRYHYLQLAKDMPQLLQIAVQGGFPGMEFGRQMAVKPVFQGMPHGRFSMPGRLPIVDQKGRETGQRRRASQFVLGLPQREEEMHSDGEGRTSQVEASVPEFASIANLLNSH
jgi:hypothetical protein